MLINYHRTTSVIGGHSMPERTAFAVRTAQNRKAVCRRCLRIRQFHILIICQVYRRDAWVYLVNPALS